MPILWLHQIQQIGLAIHHGGNLSKLSGSDKNKLTFDINFISDKLTIKQRAFSDVLGVICRQINIIVFWLDVVVTLFIMGSIILFVWITMRNMQYSQTKILEQNDKLEALNIDLDKVIYNVSHDLRSPLASLTGLISLINIEDDVDEIRSLSAMMQKSVDKQGQFINDILASIKNNQRKAVNQKMQYHQTY